MRAYLVGSVSFAMCFVAPLMVACSGDASIPDAGDDAGVQDAPAASDVVVPPNCDLAADITSSPACIDDGIGVFVDATGGNDTGLGTKASPFKTIGHAIGAAGAKPRIYVCAGTYVEDVSLTQANDVSLYGGLTCGAWKYDGNLPNVGKSTLALHVDGVVKPIVLSDLSFVASAGADPGDSSIAALVNASNDVTLRRVKLRPAAGKDGKPGVTGANWTSVSQSDATIAGHDASNATGATDHACTLCVDGKNSTGGGGGTGQLANGTSGNDGAPSLSGQSPNDGKGGAGGSCKAGDNGSSASNGTAAPGAAVLGKLTSAGWTPAPGSDGPNGGAGQGGGGGGGGASVTNPGGGGGGGCGGCGGAGGKGGSSGGASVGLAVVASKVTLNTCDIVTLAGGAGGAGSGGQDGEIGGFSGKAQSPGCQGGNGGKGGSGGAGGGGAGGVSVGVLYTDQKPAVDQATTIAVPSSPALKGTGGAAGTNDGIDGVAQAVLQAASN